jgi:Na+-driven multidrug efflux pump
VSTSICQTQQSGSTAAVVQPRSVEAQRRAARTLVLLEARIAPTLVKLAAPNKLVHIPQSAAGLIETYFVGKLGADALAGVALVFRVVMLTQMISAGAVGGGIPSAVARALGGRRRRAADDFALHSLRRGIRVAEAPAQTPRIPRRRWAREVEKP